RLEGRLEGRAEGKLEEKTEIAVKMKALNIPVEIIMKTTGLSQEDISKL
ncbi:hypothetical protein EVA_21043, partial [gut metagenome]